MEPRSKRLDKASGRQEPSQISELAELLILIAVGLVIITVWHFIYELTNRSFLVWLASMAALFIGMYFASRWQ